MKFKIVIVALAMLLLAWVAFRYSSQSLTSLSPSDGERGSTPSRSAVTVVPAVHGPVISIETDMTPPEERERTNNLARLVKGESLPVKLEQLTGYLQANHRNAESLLAAYQATRER